MFDTELESTSPKSEQDSGILDVEDDDDDEEVSKMWTEDVRFLLGLNTACLRCGEEFIPLIQLLWYSGIRYHFKYK